MTAVDPVLLADVDWPAYFRAFSEAHGGYGASVMLHGQRRILFQDGWSYNGLNHAGPEFPPPTDFIQLRDLQSRYWQQRRSDMSERLEFFRARLRQLKSLSVSRSLPLRFGPVEGEEPIADPLAECEATITWLQNDVADCSAKLVELTH